MAHQLQCPSGGSMDLQEIVEALEELALLSELLGARKEGPL